VTAVRPLLFGIFHRLALVPRQARSVRGRARFSFGRAYRVEVESARSPYAGQVAGPAASTVRKLFVPNGVGQSTVNAGQRKLEGSPTIAAFTDVLNSAPLMLNDS